MAGEGSPIGALAVRIGADATDLIDGFKKAEKATEQLERAVNAAAGAVAAASAAMAAMVLAAANGADQLGKMAQKVGVAVEQLSALKYAGALADVSLDQLGTGLKQLSKHMVENKVTGVSVHDQLLRIADEMKELGPGAEATARAMQYFGKSGADLLPMLLQGREGIAAAAAEAREFGVIVSAEAAKAAEEFNDQLTRMGQIGHGAANTLMAALLPAMTAIVDEMVKIGKETNGFKPLAEGARMVLQTVTVLGANVAYVFTQIGKDVYLVGQQLAALARGDFKAFSAISRMMKEDGERARKELDEFERRIMDVANRAPEVARQAASRASQGDIRKFENAQNQAGDPGKPETDKDAERIARQIQAGVDEEIRIQREADEVMVEMRNKQLEDEQRIRDERIQAVIDYYDQTTQIEEEALRRQHELEIAYMTDAQKFEKKSMQEKAKTIASELSNITAGVAQHNRTLFELNKAAGIANAVIAAYEGISLTMSKYPYPLNIIMAGAHGVAAFAQVSAIKNAQFGGGGGAPSIAGSTAAPPVTPVGSGAPGVAGGEGGNKNIFIGLGSGNLFSRDTVQNLIERINEELGRGARLHIA